MSILNIKNYLIYGRKSRSFGQPLLSQFIWVTVKHRLEGLELITDITIPNLGLVLYYIIGSIHVNFHEEILKTT